MNASSDRLLRRTLWGNAVFSVISGAVLVACAGPFAAWATHEPVSLAGLDLAIVFELLGLGGHKDPEVVRLIRRVRRERRWLLTANEAYIVYSLARAQSAQTGELAEVGTYEGGSSRMIC